MKYLLFVFYVIFRASLFVSANKNYGLAVAVTDKIDLIDENGSIMDKFDVESGHVTTLAYDSMYNKLYFNNDSLVSIYELDINNLSASPVPIVKKKNDDEVVVSITFDSKTRTLYWIVKNTIRHLQLTSNNEGPAFGEILYAFSPGYTPNSLAVDICKRTIYWTASFYDDNSESKSLVESFKMESDNKSPNRLVETYNKIQGIVINYSNRRVFWSEEGETHMYIKSLPLNKTVEEYKEIYKNSNSHVPISLSYLNGEFYWTDKSSNKFYKTKLDKQKTLDLDMHVNRERKSVYSIVSINKNSYINPNRCDAPPKTLTEDIHKKSVDSNNDSEQTETPTTVIPCTKEIEIVEKIVGYTNSCDNGKYSKHQDPCFNYCLNKGSCEVVNDEPQCTCTIFWTGLRCTDSKEKDNKTSDMLDRELALASLEKDDSLSEKWVYFIICGLIMLCFILIVISSVLAFKVMSLRKRPRIRKRIIVNKNVTPLTSRPQATEQCEITIENCCNMNICETPCFEPDFRKDNKGKSKKEEKTGLLTSMDLPPDDLY